LTPEGRALDYLLGLSLAVRKEPIKKKKKRTSSVLEKFKEALPEAETDGENSHRDLGVRLSIKKDSLSTTSVVCEI
jgi:hypothetical protein